jgi:hypothetical protein
MSEPATASSSTIVVGPLSNAVAFTRNSLPAPSALVVSAYTPISGSTPTLSIDADPVSGATAYIVTVSDGSGGEVLAVDDYTLGATIDASALVSNVTYQVSLCGFDQTTNTTGSAATMPLAWETVAVVSIASTTASSTAVSVAFTLVEGATSYIAQVLDSAGNQLSPALTATGTGSPLSVPASQLSIGATYQVQVRAEIATTSPATPPATTGNQTILIGAWSAPSSFVQIAPVSLCVFYPGTSASNPQGNALLYTAFNGVGWTTEAQVPNTVAAQNPGLIVSNDTLYCYHTNTATNGTLVYNAFNGTSWQANTQITASPLASGPSVCAYGGQTYCVYSGSFGACSYGNALLYNIFNGTKWVGEAQVPSTNTSLTPSAIVFNNLIYCFHQGNTSNGQLWYNTFNGTSWQGDKRITASTLVSGASACLFNGNIYCFYSVSSGALSYNVFVNGTWQGEAQVPSTSSTQSPAAIVFNNKLYCFHYGAAGSGQLRYNVFDGKSWLGDQLVKTSPLSAGPGAVLYALPASSP